MQAECITKQTHQDKVNSCDVKVGSVGWCRSNVCLLHVCHNHNTALATSILFTNCSTMQLHDGLQLGVFLQAQQTTIASEQKNEWLEINQCCIMTPDMYTKVMLADMLMLLHALGTEAHQSNF